MIPSHFDGSPADRPMHYLYAHKEGFSRGLIYTLSGAVRSIAESPMHTKARGTDRRVVILILGRFFAATDRVVSLACPGGLPPLGWMQPASVGDLHLVDEVWPCKHGTDAGLREAGRFQPRIEGSPA